MKLLKSYYVDRYKDDNRVKSIIFVQNEQSPGSLTYGSDAIVLIVRECCLEEGQPASSLTESIAHYVLDNHLVQEHMMSLSELERLIKISDDRNYICWVLQGEILLDRETYFEDFKKRLLQFPMHDRKQKLFAEFSYFVQSYLRSRQYLSMGHVLDAYSSIMEALHHWARILLYEEGQYPEIMVWNQVKQINLGIYKLYEELTLSKETLEQRVQLVILACEFSVMTKMGACCSLLFDLLKSREEPWSLNELQEHEDIKEHSVQIPLILRKLANKLLIKEVAVAIDDNFDILELRYTTK